MGVTAELFEAVVSWPTLLSVLLVFGFAPGFVLRLLVMIYPKGDARRKELVAELYVLPRLERPLFVAEQLETVLFEGMPTRFRAILRHVGHRLQRRRVIRILTHKDVTYRCSVFDGEREIIVALRLGETRIRRYTFIDGGYPREVTVAPIDYSPPIHSPLFNKVKPLLNIYSTNLGDSPRIRGSRGGHHRRRRR